MTYPAKRLLDVVASLGLLICGSPVLILTAAAIALRLGRPILWCQRRPGGRTSVHADQVPDDDRQA